MSLLQVLRDLLPLVVVLFVVEGFVWLRHDQLALVSDLGGAHRLRLGSWIGIGLPSPLLRVLRTHRSPIVLSSRGVFLRSSSIDRPPTWYDPTHFTFHPWDGLPRHLRVEGGTLIVAGTRIHLPSVGHARSSARTLLQLQAIDPIDRSEAVRHRVEDAWNPSLVRRRIADFSQATRWLTGLCWIYAMALLLGGLAITLREPTPFSTRLGLCLLAVLYLTLIVTLSQTRRSMRAAGLVDAKGAVMGAVMSPPGAALSVVQLGRDLLRDFDAGAILAVLGSAETSRLWLARELAGTDIAMASGLESDQLTAAWQEAWGVRRQAVAALLEAEGFEENELRLPPADADSETPFCTLCREVFVQTEICPDCELRLQLPRPPSPAR